MFDADSIAYVLAHRHHAQTPALDEVIAYCARALARIEALRVRVYELLARFELDREGG